MSKVHRLGWFFIADIKATTEATTSMNVIYSFFFFVVEFKQVFCFLYLVLNFAFLKTGILSFKLRFTKYRANNTFPPLILTLN